jgi:hypothetical protein
MNDFKKLIDIRPEWQPAIVGWRRFVAARPDLHLTPNYNGLNWFVRKHRQSALQAGVMRKVNGMWMCNLESFPCFAFDALLEIQKVSYAVKNAANESLEGDKDEVGKASSKF